MSSLTEALDKLLQCHSELGRPLANYLRPGLSRYALTTELSLIGSPPPDLVELYEWHDGAEEKRHIPNETCLFPYHFWCPLQAAFAHYRAKASIPRTPEHMDCWKPGWLPIFVDYGNVSCFVVSCIEAEDDYGKVIESHTFYGARTAFRSIEQMIHSLIACFESGAYYLEPDGMLGEDIDSAWSVFRELNPEAECWRQG